MRLGSTISPFKSIDSLHNTVYVLYTRLAGGCNMERYRQYLALLPMTLQRQNLRLRRWEDRWLNLYGKILLMRGLQRLNVNAHCLEQLQYTPYNRPYMPGTIDFNISHSGEYVLCAIANHIRLGIDIEKIRQIDLTEFENTMSAKQWISIQGSPDSAKAFITYWTWKEAVIKADSRGMSLSLPDILVSGVTALCDSKTWFLHNLEIDGEYCTCLATSSTEINICTEYHQL